MVLSNTRIQADLAPIRDQVLACMQCGTCTGSCPNAFAMDITPRHMWRMVLMGKTDALFQSKSFILCSSCYTCSLRCPRGLPLTEAMAALKRIAALENLKKYKASTLFYREFLESVRRHGRVQEMEFMTRYFLSMKNPFLPLKFTPLGLRLLGKGKISPSPPPKNAKRSLDAIFRKVEAMEREAEK